MAEDLRFKLILEAQNKASGELDRLAAQIDMLEKRGNKSADSMGLSFGKLGGILASVFAVDRLSQFAMGSITLAGNLEQAGVAFETMLGSAGAAKKMLANLSDFALKTPFELTGIRQTAKQLLAYGIEAEKMIPTLKALGDVSAGLSVPIQQVAYAYGQVRAANQLYGTELRQFMNAGVPILQELADMYGVTEGAARKMVEEGKVGFTDVEEAFRRMSSEGGRFENLMQKQSLTFQGAVSNMLDSIDKLKERIGGPMLEPLKKNVQDITNLISDISDESIKFVGVISSNMIDSFVNISEGFGDLLGIISVGVSGRTTLFDELLNGLASDTAETTSILAGDWTDLFIYISLGLKGITGAFKIASQIMMDATKRPVDLLMASVNVVLAAWGAIGEGVLGAFVAIAKKVANVMTDIINNTIIKALNWFVQKSNSLLGTSLTGITDFVKFTSTSMADGFVSGAEKVSVAVEAYNDLAYDMFKNSYKEMDNFADNLEQTYADLYGAKLKSMVKDGVGSTAAAVKKAADDMADAVKKAGGKGKEATEETNKELERQKKIMEEIAKETNKRAEKEVEKTEKVRNSIEDHLKGLIKLKDKYTEMGKEAIKQLQDIAAEHDNIGKGFDDKIAERIVEIDSRMKELTQKRAENPEMDWKELQALNEEEVRLQNERREAISATTQEALKFAQARDEMTKTQRLLHEEQEQLFDLEKKREKFMQEYEAKKVALDLETAAVTEALAHQIIAYEGNISSVRRMFKDHFASLETATRGHVITLVSEYQKVIDKLRELKSEGGSPSIISGGSSLPSGTDTGSGIRNPRTELIIRVEAKEVQASRGNVSSITDDMVREIEGVVINAVRNLSQGIK